MKRLARAAWIPLVILAGLILLVEGLAHLTWAMSDAGDMPFAELEKLPALVPPTEIEGIHAVEEWLADRAREFRQAPMLDPLVRPGGLRPVADRLPVDPLVIRPPEQMGPYGGVWPCYATSPQDIHVQRERITYPSLVRWDPGFTDIWPDLAVRWDVADGGRTYTFHLRRGVRWSDGKPFSADDVMFWYEAVLKNRDLTPVRSTELIRGGELVELEKVDDATVRFRFKEPHGLFLAQVASRWGFHAIRYAAHYFKQFHPDDTPLEKIMPQARAAGFDSWRQFFQDRWDWRNPDCPRLWSWVVTQPPPARPVVFERNPYYWKVDPEGRQLPYIDRVTFEMLEPATVSLRSIEGRIGLQYRHLSSDDFPLYMRNRKAGGYRVLRWLSASGGTHLLGINLNHRDKVLAKIFAEADFRKALSLAINRAELSEACFRGEAKPRQLSPLPASPFYSAEYEKAYTQYDPDRARQLLDGIGLTRTNGDGIRLRPDGKPLVVHIEAASVFFNPRLLELVARYWTAVGVKAEVRIIARQLAAERRRARLQDVSVWGGGNEMYPVLDPRWLFPTGDAALQGGAYGQWYATRGEKGEEPPPAMRECMDIYRRIEMTPDLDEQVRLLKGILDRNRENLWIIGTLGGVPGAMLVKDNFRNVPPVAMVGWPSPGNTAPECYAIDEE